MREITVAVPGDVYQAARIRAAEGNTSVSALVAELLHSPAERDQQCAPLETLPWDVRPEVGAPRGGDRPGRDELHKRPVR